MPGTEVRWPGGEPAAATTPPLISLDDALAAGTAMFGLSKISGPPAAPPVSLSRLRGRMSAICRDLPSVSTGAGWAAHTASGMTFTELAVGPSSYLVSCGPARRGVLSPGRPVDIITGSCLFGADSITGIAGGRALSITGLEEDGGYTGPPFDRVVVDDRVHVYEAEALTRLSAFIRDLAAQTAPSPVRVHAHVPGPEYVLRGLDLHARGILTSDQCARYARAVRRRGQLLGQALKTALHDIAEVLVSSPLSWLDELDPYRVPPARLPQAILDAAGRRGGLWRILAGAADPRDLRNLSNASYVHHYLAAAQRAQLDGGQLAAVENPDEVIIYQRAAALEGQTGISLRQCTGFYVHPQVAVIRTAFGLRSRYLYNCADGRDIRTIRAAVPRLGFPADTARPAAVLLTDLQAAGRPGF